LTRADSRGYLFIYLFTFSPEEECGADDTKGLRRRGTKEDGGIEIAQVADS
jgi:hypothetical protein